jgi:hypothetical protein
MFFNLKSFYGDQGAPGVASRILTLGFSLGMPDSWNKGVAQPF